MIRIEATTYLDTDGSAQDRIEITWDGEDTRLVADWVRRVGSSLTQLAAVSKMPQTMMQRIDFDYSPDRGTEARRWPCGCLINNAGAHRAGCSCGAFGAP